MNKKARPMVEVSEEARYLFKAVAALQGKTMRDLIEETARDLAKRQGVTLPPSFSSTNATQDQG